MSLEQGETIELKVTPDRFLTVRYRLFTVIASRLTAAEAEHRPCRCTAPGCSAWTRTLLQRARLPAPPRECRYGADPDVAPVKGLPAQAAPTDWNPAAMAAKYVFGT